jgi:hypothetical protein
MHHKANDENDENIFIRRFNYDGPSRFRQFSSFLFLFYPM